MQPLPFVRRPCGAHHRGERVCPRHGRIDLSARGIELLLGRIELFASLVALLRKLRGTGCDLRQRSVDLLLRARELLVRRVLLLVNLLIRAGLDAVGARVLALLANTLGTLLYIVDEGLVLVGIGHEVGRARHGEVGNRERIAVQYRAGREEERVLRAARAAKRHALAAGVHVHGIEHRARDGVGAAFEDGGRLGRRRSGILARGTFESNAFTRGVLARGNCAFTCGALARRILVRRIFGRGVLGHRVLVLIQTLERDLVADLLAARIEVLLRDGDLVHITRQAALEHLGLVQASRGKRLDVHFLARVVHRGVGRLGVAALGDIHAVELAERLDIGAVQAERRLDGDVEQPLVVIVAVRRKTQVVAGRLEAHEQGDAQRRDDRERHELLEIPRDGAPDIRGEGRRHHATASAGRALNANVPLGARMPLLVSPLTHARPLPLDVRNRGGASVHLHVGHAAAVEADEAIGHGRERGVVRDDEHRDAVAATRVLQQLQYLLAGLVVERAGGLVAQQQLGVLGDGAGDGHALLLAARKLRREVRHALT